MNHLLRRKARFSYYQDVNSFLVLFLVTLLTFVVAYIILFGIWQGTYKSDWFTLYNINVFVARKFNDLRLLLLQVLESFVDMR